MKARSSPNTQYLTQDTLIDSHRYLVPLLCRRWFSGEPAHIRDDLISVGNEALVKAARSHDPNCGAKFSTYATPAIRWAMLTYLREMKKEQARQGVSLDDAPGDEPDALTLAEKTADTDPDPEEALLSRLDAAALWSAVETLKPVQADVLRRFYQRGENFTEIGAPCGHHKSWAKRIHDAGVNELRQSLPVSPICST